MGSRRTLALLLPALACCGPEASPLLVVQLRSDFVPGVEFTAAAVAVYSAETGELVGGERAVPPADADLAAGVAVAELDGLGVGRYRVELTLRDERDARVAGAQAVIELRAPLSLTLVVARACRSLACPEPGGPATHTECAAGRCVTPACAESAAACEAACAADADCAAPAGACARARCLEGECLAVPDRTACAEAEYCDPDLGCTPLPFVPCATDAECADELPCTTDERCELGRCTAAGGDCTPGTTRPCPACAAGTQACNTDCTWSSACAPRPGAAERPCNGRDDDCSASTPDDACGPDDACAGGACQPLAPILESIEPASGTQPRCACIDFVARGAHFRPGIVGYARDWDIGPVPPVTEFAVELDSSTQLRLRGVCTSNAEDGGFDAWFANPDGQRTSELHYTFARSAPRIARVSPTSARVGERVCPTFFAEPTAGFCTSTATASTAWYASDCGSPPVVIGPFPLAVASGDPRSATSIDAGCFDIPLDGVPGTYCLWVVDADGGESDRGAPLFTILP